MPLVDLSELPLNWEMATARFERDVRNDFFPDPLKNRDLFTAAKSRLDSVLDVAAYEPEQAESWDVPKANLTLRHCINITAVDRLVYQVLADHLCEACDPKFSARSYAFRLRTPAAAEMYRNTFQQFTAFNGAVAATLLARPASVVVTLDVAQYFENISFELLKKKLIELTGARLGHPTRAVIDVLTECLCKWSPYKSCGVPQNMFPSSFLGNVYLDSLDVLMVERGYDYHRYVDDVRVVAATEGTARQALRDMITHLRELELSVNGKKTRIVRPGTTEWLELIEPPNPEFADIERIIERRILAELPACVERLNVMLQEVVAAGGQPERELKFCVNRLTSLRRLRKIPVPEPDGLGASLLRLLIVNPDFTTSICEYFNAGGASDSITVVLAELLTAEPRCVYGWQNYHLWLLAAKLGGENAALLDKAREVIRAPRDTPELAGAAIYMGTVGAAVELIDIAAALATGRESVTVVRALVTALQRSTDEGVPAILARLAARSPTLGVLERYLGRVGRSGRTRYVAGPRRIPLGRLADEMPDLFS